MKVNLTLLKIIHNSIDSGATGNPTRFAEKLGVSRRLLLEILKLLKEEFDAPIEYSRSRETYYYTEDCIFYFGVVRNRKTTMINEVVDAMNKAAAEVISKNLLVSLCLFLIC